MKNRLDSELVRRGLARSRENAADLIESRSVLVNGIPATKSAGAKAASDPALAPFIKLLPNAVFYPGDVASWNSVKGQIQQGIGQVVSGDPAAVLGQLQTAAAAAK